MRTIAVLNWKGGSGKSTTAVNLAAAMGESGRRVLLLDLDPQCSAGTWLGVVDAGRSLLDVLTDGRDLAALPRPSVAPGVDVVPSSPSLARAERELLGAIGGDRVLAGQLEGMNGYHVALLDCPPSLGTLTANALAAADGLIIPVECGSMALAGLAELLRTVGLVRQRVNPRLAVDLIVPCRVDRTRVAGAIIAELRARFPAETSRAVVRESVRLREAWSHRLPILTYAPTSTGAADYRALAGELAERAGL